MHTWLTATEHDARYVADPPGIVDRAIGRPTGIAPQSHDTPLRTPATNTHVRATHAYAPPLHAMLSHRTLRRTAYAHHRHSPHACTSRHHRERSSNSTCRCEAAAVNPL